MFLKADDTMSDSLSMGTNNIINIGSLSGATNTRTADNIMSSSTAQTTDSLIAWSSSSKTIKDSGISTFNVVTGPTSAINSNLLFF